MLDQRVHVVILYSFSTSASYVKCLYTFVKYDKLTGTLDDNALKYLKNTNAMCHKDNLCPQFFLFPGIIIHMISSCVA